MNPPRFRNVNTFFDPMGHSDLSLDKKISLIKERDNGIAYRVLAEKYKISLGAVANIIKRRDEYVSDYETIKIKKPKEK